VVQNILQASSQQDAPTEPERTALIGRGWGLVWRCKGQIGIPSLAFLRGLVMSTGTE
jgi:hypothetical protein